MFHFNSTHSIVPFLIPATHTRVHSSQLFNIQANSRERERECHVRRKRKGNTFFPSSVVCLIFSNNDDEIHSIYECTSLVFEREFFGKFGWPVPVSSRSLSPSSSTLLLSHIARRVEYCVLGTQWKLWKKKWMYSTLVCWSSFVHRHKLLYYEMKWWPASLALARCACTFAVKRYFVSYTLCFHSRNRKGLDEVKL